MMRIIARMPKSPSENRRGLSRFCGVLEAKWDCPLLRGGSRIGSKWRQSPWIAIAAAALLVAHLAGCGAKVDPRIAHQRQRLVLADEPAGATSILAAKKQLPADGEVTLVGTIGAGDDDPFEKNQAAFFLCELPAHDHAGHDAANCPFCKHRASETPRVVVQFVDDAGQVLPIDSRELLGVKKGQVVVVRGQGQLNDTLDLLVVTASGIHIRR